jgi:hypothetical protein
MGQYLINPPNSHANWLVVTLPHLTSDDMVEMIMDAMTFEVTMDQRTGTKLSAHLWCMTEMVTGKFMVEGDHFHFENPRDAMAFKLVWS